MSLQHVLHELAKWDAPVPLHRLHIFRADFEPASHIAILHAWDADVREIVRLLAVGAASAGNLSGPRQERLFRHRLAGAADLRRQVFELWQAVGTEVDG